MIALEFSFYFLYLIKQSMAFALCTFVFLCTLSLALSSKTVYLKNAIQWIQTGEPSADELINMIWAVKQSNLDVLDSMFWEISSPRAQRYAQYLSLSELDSIISPSQSTVQKIRDFVSSHNGHSETITAASDFMEVTMRVADVESVFKTKLHYFERHDKPMYRYS